MRKEVSIKEITAIISETLQKFKNEEISKDILGIASLGATVLLSSVIKCKEDRNEFIDIQELADIQKVFLEIQNIVEKSDEK